jgi:hypothetical protein
LELSVVLSLQNGQLSGELLSGGQEPSKVNEDSHDFDIDEDGPFALKYEDSMATPCSVKAYGE